MRVLALVLVIVAVLFFAKNANSKTIKDKGLRNEYTEIYGRY